MNSHQFEYNVSKTAGNTVLLIMMGLYPENLTIAGLNHCWRHSFEVFVPRCL